MARKPRAAKPNDSTAGVGHNSFDNLTDEQFGDLSCLYQVKVRAAQAAADVAKAKYDELRGEVNGLVKRMTADLKITRKDFLEFLTDLDMRETDRVLKLARRQRLYASAGIGTQMGLFDTIQDTVTDQQEAEQAGRAAFMRAEYGTPPPELDPMFHQDWLRGYHAEQEATAAKMGRAEAFLKAREEPDAEQEAVDLNEDEGESDDSDAETSAERDPEDEETPEFLRRLAGAGSVN